MWINLICYYILFYWRYRGRELIKMNGDVSVVIYGSGIDVMDFG